MESSPAEPACVRLTGDYLDLVNGVGFSKGTVLVRRGKGPGVGQYAPEGAGLGQPCVCGFDLMEGIAEVIAD